MSSAEVAEGELSMLTTHSAHVVFVQVVTSPYVWQSLSYPHRSSAGVDSHALFG